MIDSPRVGAAVASPLVVRGSIAQTPPQGALAYRVFDAAGSQVGSGQLQVQGAPGQRASFDGQVRFTVTSNGPGRLELVDLNNADGSIRAIASVALALQTGTGVVPTTPPAATRPAGIPTPLLPTLAAPPTAVPTIGPPTPILQNILIDAPPAGTVVGSPVVVAGRTTLFPSNGQLFYRVRDSNGRDIGSGPMTVFGGGQGSSFTASLVFSEPPGGGSIYVELYDQNQNTGAVLSSVLLTLFVAPPQTITIDSPGPGQFVGSPVVLAGRVARLPFDSSLAYRFIDAQGRQLGAGTFPVAGAPGAPANFSVSLDFNLPPDGGQLRVELIDQRATDGLIAARATLGLQVAPQQQALLIDTPPPGTQVGSPVVLTGRTVRYPFQGKLSYRVFDANGQQIGAGAFNVSGVPDQATRFTASLTFNPPAQGGAIRIELLDQNAQTGVIVANASLGLQVAPPAPTRQEIVIDSPPPGTFVGSPVVVTGRSALFPASGTLDYRVRDANGRQIGAGSIVVDRAGVGGTFVGSLDFRLLGAGQITVEVLERNASNGAIVAVATVDLQVEAPYPQPREGG